MSEMLLEQNYYFDADGKKDAFYDMSYYCLVTCIYEMSKNKTPRAKELMYSLIEDISLYITLDGDGKIEEIFTNEADEKNCNFTLKEYEEKDEAAIKLLHKLLEEGETVIVCTVTEMLDFSVNYIPDYDIKAFDPGHVFSILHYDGEYYYYLEDPFAQINYEKFVPYKNRKDIGMMTKAKMEAAFRAYLRCFTVTFNWEQPNLIEERVRDAVESSIQSYSKANSYLEDNKVTYTGRNAICKLIDLASQGINLKESIPGVTIKLIGFLPWVFSILYKKRKLLTVGLKVLSEQKEDFKLNLEIVSTLKQSEKLWTKCKNRIEKNKQRGKYIFDTSYIPILEELIEVEDKLNEFLKELL